jgi:uncharacterized membrane-anchored protein
MKRFIVVTFSLLMIASAFFYLGYQPQINDIDFTGSLLGYNIQTSQYTVYGVLVILFIIASIVMRFFAGIKKIYNIIINFFTGHNKDKALENLLNAYAHLIGKQPKTAKNYLRKAEKYYKNSEHIALIKLMIDQSENAERPATEALAKIENHKILKPVGAYVESLFPLSHKDDTRMIALLKESGSYAQDLNVLYAYMTLLVRHKDYTEAENALKLARSIIADDTYKFHMATLNILKSHQAYEDKNPDTMLAFGLEALKFDKNPIALGYVVQAYKTLQRDNKATRLLHDYFLDVPYMNYLRVFLELKSTETFDDTAKRIAALPRTHENSEAFLCLQAYHFAVSKDFMSLNSILNNHPAIAESLWAKAAKLCLLVEKDAVLLLQTFKLFKDAIDAHCSQEITDIYSKHNGNVYCHTFIFDKLISENTKATVSAQLSLFKEMLKSVPILQKKNTLSTMDTIQSPNLYQLEANIYKDITE